MSLWSIDGLLYIYIHIINHIYIYIYIYILWKKTCFKRWVRPFNRMWNTLESEVKELHSKIGKVLQVRGPANMLRLFLVLVWSHCCYIYIYIYVYVHYIIYLIIRLYIHYNLTYIYIISYIYTYIMYIDPIVVDTYVYILLCFSPHVSMETQKYSFCFLHFAVVMLSVVVCYDVSIHILSIIG